MNDITYRLRQTKTHWTVEIVSSDSEYSLELVITQIDPKTESVRLMTRFFDGSPETEIVSEETYNTIVDTIVAMEHVSVKVAHDRAMRRYSTFSYAFGYQIETLKKEALRRWDALKLFLEPTI
jgi:hypothetical protein